jgi:hypothetical protein
MPAEAKTGYMLIRAVPGTGQEKTQGPVKDVRAATILAAYVLHDNAGVSKADAQRFSVVLGRAPVGTTVPHEASGYKFCIVASETGQES